MIANSLLSGWDKDKDQSLTEAEIHEDLVASMIRFDPLGSLDGWQVEEVLAYVTNMKREDGDQAVSAILRPTD